MKFISEWNLKFVILTCGTNGSHIYTDTEESLLETPQVEVVDTVGAGDSFIGTFMASILKGQKIKDAHELAVRSQHTCAPYTVACATLLVYVHVKRLKDIIKIL
jgi:fructokinase